MSPWFSPVRLCEAFAEQGATCRATTSPERHHGEWSCICHGCAECHQSANPKRSGTANVRSGSEADTKLMAGMGGKRTLGRSDRLNIAPSGFSLINHGARRAYYAEPNGWCVSAMESYRL